MEIESTILNIPINHGRFVARYSETKSAWELVCPVRSLIDLTQLSTAFALFLREENPDFVKAASTIKDGNIIYNGKNQPLYKALEQLVPEILFPRKIQQRIFISGVHDALLTGLGPQTLKEYCTRRPAVSLEPEL